MDDDFFGPCSTCDREMPLDREPPHGRCDDCLDVAGVAKPLHQPCLWTCILRVMLALMLLLTGLAVCGMAVVRVNSIAPSSVALFLAGWLIVGAVALVRLMGKDVEG